MAFVTNTWNSANGDPNDANSWTGGVPAANDVCVFDDTSQQSVIHNLGVVQTFEQLLVKPSYHGDIGFAGNPWRVNLGLDTLVYRGAGQAFIHCATGSSANVIVDVDRSLRPAQASLTLGGLGIGNGCSLSMVAIKRGRARILGDVNLSSDVYVLGSAARLLLDANLGGMVEPGGLVCTAGYLESRRTLLANRIVLVAAGGLINQIGALPATTRVITVGSGKFHYNPVAAPGTSPTLLVFGGVYDQTNEKYDNTWGTTVIGPDGYVVGSTIRGSAVWPASYDLRDEYPGPQE